MAGTLASTAILTKGLTCGQVGACAFGSMLTTPYDLFCRVQRKPAPRRGSGGGGPYPFPAWNRIPPGQSHKFFKPIDTIDELQGLFKPLQQNTNAAQPYYIVPYDQLHNYFNTSSEKQVTINMVVDGKEASEKVSVEELKDANVEIRNLSSKKVKPHIDSIHGKQPRVKSLRGKAPKIKTIRDKYPDE